MLTARLHWILSAIVVGLATFAAAMLATLSLDWEAFVANPVITSFVTAGRIAAGALAAHWGFEYLRRSVTGRRLVQVLISTAIVGLTIFSFGGVAFFVWFRAIPELGASAATLAYAGFMAAMTAIAAGHAACFQAQEQKARATLSAEKSSTRLVIGGILLATLLATGFQTISVVNNVRHWKDVQDAVSVGTLLREQLSVIQLLEPGIAPDTHANILADFEQRQARLPEFTAGLAFSHSAFALNGLAPFRPEPVIESGQSWCHAIEALIASPESAHARFNVMLLSIQLQIVLRANIDLVDKYVAQVVPVIAAGQRGRTIFGPIIIILYALSLLVPVLQLVGAHQSRLSRLSMTLQQTRVPVILSDAKHRIAWVNKAFEEVTGFAAAEVTGAWVPGLLQRDENDPETLERFSIALRARKPFRETVCNRRRDGTRYWIDLDIQPVFSSAGKFEGYRTAASDVTALVEAARISEANAQALEASEHKFRALAENSPDVIVSMSANGEITYVSPAVRLFGYEPAELLGFNGYRLIHPEDAEKTVKRTQTLLATGEIAPDSERIMRYMTRDGRAIWLESSPSILRGPDGAITGLTLQMRNIDDRKRVLDELAEREALLESITGISGVGGWSLDLATMRPVWSATARAIHEVDERFQPTPEDATGFFAPEAQPRIRQALSDAIASGKPWDLELPLFTAKGRKLFVRTTGRPEMQDGKTVRLIGAIQDITAIEAAKAALVAARDEAQSALAESARFQAALKEERKRLSNVIEATKVGSWEIDLVTGNVWINERWAEMIGYTVSELGPMNVERLKSQINADDLAAADDILNAHLRGETDYFEIEQRVYHRDGQEIWVQTRGSVTARAGDGSPLLISGTRQDITARKLADDRMRLLNDRLGLAVEASNTGVWEYDMNSRVLVWDARVRELFGAMPGFVPTFEAWKALVHPDDAERTFSDMYTARRVGEIWRAQYRVVRPDGTIRHVRNGARFYKDARGVGCIVGVVWDVTAEVRRNEELDRKRLEAESAAMAKSQFLATMSHEIRTPMNGVLGMLELLMRSALTDEQRGRAEMAHESAQGLLTILNDILDISKLEANQVRIEALPVAVRPLVQDVLGLFRARAPEKGITLSFDVAKGVPEHVVTDPTRLRQILVNLVGNAIKFTDSGNVRIEVATGSPAGPGELCFRVMDTGIGIPEEVRDKLFQRFMQADSSTTRKFGGTGLGLAICRQLTGLLGGQIGVEPNPCGGSIFWFTIRAPEAKAPALPGTATRIAPKPVHMDAAGSRPLNILVAEDNLINQKIIRAFLAPGRHAIDIAANGAEALTALERKAYDLVLMDVQMPVMDGITATRLIRESNAAWKDIPIIALTANAMAGDRERYLSLGMNGYVSKPVNVNNLFAEIAAVTAHLALDDADAAARA